MTTTTIITTIILLLAIGIVTVLAGFPKANAPIESCCCFGFNTLTRGNQECIHHGKFLWSEML